MSPGPNDCPELWLVQPDHRRYLARNALKQLDFFSACLGDGPGFSALDQAGVPEAAGVQELHNTTRLVHSYALAQMMGYQGAAKIVDRGMSYLNRHHRDTEYGGYVWALDDRGVTDDRKLAYGHVFVLFAASSAKLAGHPDADALLDDAATVLDRYFWEEQNGLFADEWNRDWTPFSTYRGMNANMHGVEALLAAYEATGDSLFLNRAGRILDFFTAKIAPTHKWRLPEHYKSDWQVDQEYEGNPMFRPRGTTPGHSFELARLLLQYWDLCGRPATDAPRRARQLIERALDDAWLPEGGIAYTLDYDGSVGITSRFWWPVTEALGALAALLKLEGQKQDEVWYRKLWQFADSHFIDHVHGGWFPEIDANGRVTTTIFERKPDIYHALQACLFPLVPGLSRPAQELAASGALEEGYE